MTLTSGILAFVCLTAICLLVFISIREKKPNSRLQTILAQIAFAALIAFAAAISVQAS